MNCKKSLNFAIMLIALLFITSVNAYAAVVPVPSGKLIPRTAASIPWQTADKLIVPINLSQYGYVEEEYFLTGTANLYDWASAYTTTAPADPSVKVGPATVNTAGVAYTNVILVTRPANMNTFSGNVWVEVGNATSGYDKHNTFGNVWPYILRSGDVHIEVNSQKGTAANYKKFNPVRYASVDFTNNGQFWDIYSQTAAWVRSNNAENPFKGQSVYLYGTGQSQSSVMLNTYINAVLPISTQSNGKYIFDGFSQNTGPNYFAIKDGDKSPYSVWSRGIVPVIRTHSSADFPNMMGPSDNPALSSRRPDSDVPGDRYRLVEIPGNAHNSIFFNIYGPNDQEVNSIGYTNSSTAWVYDANKSTHDFPGNYFYRASMDNLKKWVRNGVTPPYAPRITYQAMHGPEKLEYAQDTYGNPLGGLRNPWVDYPTGTYSAHNYTDSTLSSTNQFTRGYKTPFSSDRLRQMYGTKANLMRQYYQGIDQLVAGRWLTPQDAAQAKVDIATPSYLWPYIITAFPGGK